MAVQPYTCHAWRLTGCRSTSKTCRRVGFSRCSFGLVPVFLNKFANLGRTEHVLLKKAHICRGNQLERWILVNKLPVFKGKRWIWNMDCAVKKKIAAA